jgi:acetoacetyl-CoA synthetase
MTAEELWSPGAGRRASSSLGRFVDWVAQQGWVRQAGWDDVWEWSVSDLGGFWSALATWADLQWAVTPSQFFVGDPSSGAGPLAPGMWCPGGRCNYAQRALGWEGRSEVAGAPAVLAYSQTRATASLSWPELADHVRRAATGLRRAGVGPGDRVAGYLPNIPEALVAFLAAASVGAVWTVCSPETGPRAVLDRFGPMAPSVLIGADGYRYGAKRLDRSAELREVVAGLPSLRRTVLVSYLDPDPPLDADWWSWEALLAEAPAGSEAEPVALDFDHPLYVLYSSGTTGPPKAIVHRHGGILLEHLKTLQLHHDLEAGDRLFWATTTTWMMWNFVVSGLLVGATVVLADGDLGADGGRAMWDVVADSRATVAGMGAGHLVAGRHADLCPRRTHDLGALEVLGSTGSPLPAGAARWVYEAVVSPSTALASISGGTDVCTGFVGWSPLHPVWAGEISTRCLGAAVEVLDDDGRPVIGREGELVVGRPMPSMPVGFWHDEDGHRYREAYFAQHPGYWTHGDRMTLTERGSCIITGRSDGTLNRGGVRMGTAEFYDVLGDVPEIADSLVVHVEDAEGGSGTLWLFVVCEPGAELAGPLDERIRAVLRTSLSPRHVPDRLVAVDAVPKTLSGKKLEVPIKRILAGLPLEQALRRGAVANPESLTQYLAFAP